MAAVVVVVVVVVVVLLACLLCCITLAYFPLSLLVSLLSVSLFVPRVSALVTVRFFRLVCCPDSLSPCLRLPSVSVSVVSVQLLSELKFLVRITMFTASRQ